VRLLGVRLGLTLLAGSLPAPTPVLPLPMPVVLGGVVVLGDDKPDAPAVEDEPPVALRVVAAPLPPAAPPPAPAAPLAPPPAAKATLLETAKLAAKIAVVIFITSILFEWLESKR
jgi:hypothetical protein